MELLGRYSKLANLPDFPHITPRGPATKKATRVHSARRRLGEDIIAQISHDYEAGQPTTALMATYGLGKGSVLSVLQEAGVPMRGQGLCAEHLDRAIELYQSGASLQAVGATFGCNAETVRKTLVAAGITMRPRPGWTY